jgi:hypothetical protein
VYVFSVVKSRDKLRATWSFEHNSVEFALIVASDMWPGNGGLTDVNGWVKYLVDACAPSGGGVTLYKCKLCAEGERGERSGSDVYRHVLEHVRTGYEGWQPLGVPESYGRRAWSVVLPTHMSQVEFRRDRNVYTWNDGKHSFSVVDMSRLIFA